MDDMNGIVGYTLLARYDTAKDLLPFKGDRYQPQITINVRPAKGRQDDIEVSLDSHTGFKLIELATDGDVAEPGEDAARVEGAMLNLPDGAQHLITEEEARGFILRHYERFEAQNDPIGHRCYYS